MINATNFYYPTNGGISKSGKWIAWQQLYPRFSTPDSLSRGKSSDSYRRKIHSRCESPIDLTSKELPVLKYKLFSPRAIGQKLELNKIETTPSRTRSTRGKKVNNFRQVSAVERLYTSVSIDTNSDDEKEASINIPSRNQKTGGPRYRRLITDHDGKERVLRSVFSRTRGELYYEPTLDSSLYKSFHKDSLSSKTFIEERSKQDSQLFVAESHHELIKPISYSSKMHKLKEYRFSHPIKKSPFRSTPGPQTSKLPNPKLEIDSSKIKLNIRSSRKMHGLTRITTGTDTQTDNIIYDKLTS